MVVACLGNSEGFHDSVSLVTGPATVRTKESQREWDRPITAGPAFPREWSERFRIIILVQN